MHKIVGIVLGTILISALGRLVSADTVIPDDLAVQGGICLGGPACVSGITQNSQLLIKADPNSTVFDPEIRLIDATSSQNWRIGGGATFSIIDKQTTPPSTPQFYIDRGAPSGSLSLRSDGTVVIAPNTGNGFLPAQTLPAQLYLIGDATQDVFSGIGPDPKNGPAFNFGYSGSSFGRSSGFFNVRPDGDPSVQAPNPSLRFMTANIQRMIIANTGFVGLSDVTVGGAQFVPTQRLDVNGNVRVRGSVITNTTIYPDYVFEPDYKLMPLPELATYVKQEKHLPDIPTAQEIKTHGVNMSQLQIQLLKKVEELTLYTVQQEKANTQQEKTIQALTSLVTQLTARVASLEQARGKLEAWRPNRDKSSRHLN